MSDVKSVIESGRAVLGIEFGSTRIKAVLIGVPMIGKTCLWTAFGHTALI